MSCLDGPYPFIPGKGGIPLDGLEEANTAIRVVGGSGRPLLCEVGLNLSNGGDIKVEDCELPLDYFMEASARNGRVSFNISTRGEKFNPHPDFYAKYFVDLAMTNLYPIDVVRTSWDPYSVNRHMFNKIYQQTGNPELAARSTWSGRAIARHGFTHIESITNREASVVVIFTKK